MSDPLGQNATSWLRVPVTGESWSVTDLASKATVASQATALDARTKSLPLLYLNKFGLTGAAIASETAKISNKATHVLTFPAALPPVGFATFSVVKKAAASSLAVAADADAAPTTVTNGVCEFTKQSALVPSGPTLKRLLVITDSLTIDHAKGTVTSIKNLISGAETPLNVSWASTQAIRRCW